MPEDWQNQSPDDYYRSQGLVLNSDGTEWVRPPSSWVDSTPAPYQNPDASPADIAAYRVAKSVKRPVRLPVEQNAIPDAPSRPSYVMEPDLQEAQGGMQLPPGMMQDDSGRLFYADDPTTTIPMVKRPGLLPVANTPEGLKLVIPKMLDLASNVMGNVGGVMGGKVAAKAGEMVLGSGMVKSAMPIESKIKDLMKKWDDAGVRNYVAEQSKAVGGHLKLHDLVVPKDKRGSGVGTQFMEDLTKLADEEGKKVVLTAAKDYGATSVDRLKSFYKRFGFVENKGRNKDFRVSDNMYRDPILKSDTRNQVAGQVGHQVEKNGFYSALQTAVSNAKVDKADASQWLGYLKNQPGVKSEELNYTLGNLPEGQISRSQLEDIVKQNKVELREKVSGEIDSPQIKELDKQIRELSQWPNDPQKAKNPKDQKTLDDLNLRWNDLQNDYGTPTKYHSYQLPGGENYKEMLLKLPQNMVPNGRYVVTDGTPTFNMAANTKSEAQEILNNMQKHSNKPLSIVEDKMPDTYNNFQSSHWDEPNVLAHIRMNDRNLPIEFTSEEKAALQKHEEAQPYLDKLRQSQADVGNKIAQMAKPLEAARRAKILADNKAGKISNAEAVKQMEGYEVHSELKPLQNKLSKLRQEEDNIRKSLPTKPEQKLQKVLHVEEIQSDLHQKGRDLGYKGEVEKLQPDFDKIEEKLMATNDEKMLGQATVKDVLKEAVDKKIITPAEAKTYQRYTDIENHMHEAIPDLPFKNNWEELALKRVVRHAAKNGYDAISWEHGNAQALRYPDAMRQQINGIEWGPRAKYMEKYHSDNLKEGVTHIVVDGKEGKPWFNVDKNGNVVSASTNEAKGKHLSDVVGKDMSKQILEKGEGNIDAKDFVMGAEGMKAAYDVRLPNKINEIGKKYGSKVEEKEIAAHKIMRAGPEDWRVINLQSNQAIARTFKTKELAEAYSKEHGGSKPIHYFPITPALRDKATKEGFPLFSSSPVLSPVTHNPFDDSQNKKYRLTPVQGNPFQ